MDLQEVVSEILLDPEASEFFNHAKNAVVSKGKGRSLNDWDRFTEQSVG
jgi:hypothetical protein